MFSIKSYPQRKVWKFTDEIGEHMAPGLEAQQLDAHPKLLLEEEAEVQELQLLLKLQSHSELLLHHKHLISHLHH